jgi:hypothetical protein
MATAGSTTTEVLMVRKLVFVLCAMSLTLASCGHQVTPNRTGTSGQGLQPGFMQIKFNTYQPMDFANVWYVIALNTSGPAPGTNGEPYAFFGNTLQNWVNYSFEIIVYQLQGQSAPSASLVQFVTTTGVGGGTIKVPTTLGVNPQQLQLIPNCNGNNTQLCLTIDRHIFSGLNQATPTPSASPSTSPSASPTGSPSPSPTASSAPPAITGIWYINWFTVQPTGTGPQGGGNVIDQPGPQGPSDRTWLPPNVNYDTASNFDLPWNAVPVPGWPQVTPPEAQIAGGEVLNAP